MAGRPLQPPWPPLQLCKPEASCQEPLVLIFKAITTQDCILEVPNSTSTDPYVQCYDTQTNKRVAITGSTMSHPTSPLTIPHTEIQPLPTEVVVLVAPTANKHMHHLQSTTRCGGTPLPNGKIQQNNGNNPSLHGITELLEKHKKGTISSLPSHKQSTLQSIPEAHCLQLTDHTVLQHWLTPTCAIHQLHTQQVSQTPHTRDSMKAISRHLHPTTTHNPPGTTISTAPVDNNEPSLAPLNNSHPLKSNSHPNLAPTNSCCNALPNPTHE